MVKKCTSCDIEKDLTNFVKHKKSPDGLSYWCKDCIRKYNLNRYYKDVEKSREYSRCKKSEYVSWIQNLKLNKPCIDCGKIYEPYCMDYDHIPGRGKKINTISRLVLSNIPKNIVLDEIEKCDLVCILCHNNRTNNRLNEKYLDRKYRKHQLRNIEIINSFKSNPCYICSHQYDLHNMQIDHIDPSNKLYNICSLKSCRLNILLLELEKCKPICALCHRKKSIEEQLEGKYNIERPKNNKIKEKLFHDIEWNIKECSKCHHIKNFNEFSKKNNSKDGLEYICKDCCNILKKIKRGTYNPDIPENHKKCSHCKKIKENNNFFIRTDGGLFSWCKVCINEYRKNKRKNK